jgi:hypothetical protein
MDGVRKATEVDGSVIAGTPERRALGGPPATASEQGWISAVGRCCAREATLPLGLLTSLDEEVAVGQPECSIIIALHHFPSARTPPMEPHRTPDRALPHVNPRVSMRSD